MAKIIITRTLADEIEKKFQGESVKIFELMHSLKENPLKGKKIGNIGGILIKELKYRNFRFYFITNGYKIKFLESDEFKELIIKFVRMSDKKNQKKTIEEIKKTLRLLEQNL